VAKQKQKMEETNEAVIEDYGGYHGSCVVCIYVFG
jgi:hypothetical protein